MIASLQSRASHPLSADRAAPPEYNRTERSAACWQRHPAPWSETQADVAEIGDIAKIVDTTALRTDARQHPRQIPLICDRERRPRDAGVWQRLHKMRVG